MTELRTIHRDKWEQESARLILTIRKLREIAAAMTDPDADRSTVVLHRSGTNRGTCIELSIADAHELLDHLTRCVATAENYKTHCNFDMSAVDLAEPNASRISFVINRRV
jgi:hypothetical protein